MLRKTLCARSSYLVQQRVVPDWWQTQYRDELYRRARARIATLVDVGTTPGHDIAPASGQARDLPADHGAAWPSAQADAVSEEDTALPAVKITAQRLSTNVTDAASATVSTSSTAPMLLLYEANALAGTFASRRNTEDLGRVLQYIRETVQIELTSFHYNTLLRTFNVNKDKEGMMQLLDVMTQQGTAVTLEMYARVVDGLHCLAPPDVLSRILTVCSLAQARFANSHVFDAVAGSEAATVAMYRLRPDTTSNDDATHVDTDVAVVARYCPVLTSLLHHVANSGGGGPVAALLVALWIRAFDIPLGDWDYVLLFGSLLREPEAFVEVQAVFGAYHDWPCGVVSPHAVLDRVDTVCQADSVAGRVGQAMRASLQQAGIDPTRPIEAGVANTQTTGLAAMIDRLLRDATRRGAVGPCRYSATILYHTLTLLYSTTRDQTEAVGMLRRAVERRDELDAEEEQHRPQPTDPRGEVTSSTAAEPFVIDAHYLLDIGSLLKQVSLRTVQDEVAAAYSRCLRELTQHPSGAFPTSERTSNDAIVTASSHSSSTLSSLSSRADGNEGVVTLAAPPSAAVLRRGGAVAQCETYMLCFIETNEQASEALRQLAAVAVNPAQGRLSRTTRTLFRQFAEFCARHPQRNCKLSPTGLEERRKWGAYLDARDTSLALFGSTRQARDSMKHLFYNHNQLPELRSAAMIAKDVKDVAQIFFPDADPAKLRQVATGELLTQRTTLPHLRFCPDAVPRHLYDPAVYNPYPQIMLRQSALVEEHVTEDFFAEFWRLLMDRTVVGDGVWYLQSSEMYMALMRCLLHRLDWEAAVHLTAKMQEHTVYTYLMDHELTTIFREIGDPAGCLAFKVATRLFDGRIVRDGQTKRERFHLEQFADIKPEDMNTTSSSNPLSSSVP